MRRSIPVFLTSWLALGFAACSSSSPSANPDGGDAGPHLNDGGTDGGDAGPGPAACDGGCPTGLTCEANTCAPINCSDGGSCPSGFTCQGDYCGSASGCSGCTPSEVCVNGACVSTSPCGPHESVCGMGASGYCANLNDDSENCGTCARVCGAGQRCSRGQCQASCAGDEVACSADAGTLCAEVATDNKNCGACGNSCPTGQVCTGGQCAASCAPPTQGTCGSGAATYCANLQNNPLDCGTCGTACPTNQYCSEGECAARCIGLTDQLCGGICVDLQSDLESCGACGDACPAGQVCYGSACTATCGPPDTTCVIAGKNLCANLLEDSRNCGACGNACAAGQVCADGVCAASCIGASGTLCDGVCVHLASDDQNCGSCGASCPTGQYCNGLGSCASSCGAGFQLCGAGTAAECASLQADPDNCGACGHLCGDAGACGAGVCGGPSPSAICDGGCAPGFACLGGSCASQTCPDVACAVGFACVDGGCVAPGCAGVVCPTGQGCGNGGCYPQSCGGTSCDAGLCDQGTCVAPDCAGVGCDGGQVCFGGACVASCTGCSVPNLCIGGACVAGCSIASAMYPAGAIDPQNECQYCDPANPTAWTPLSGNVCAGVSNYCATGICTELCTIAGATYANGAANPQNACQVCTVSANPLGWSGVTANQSCATDGGSAYCENGECLSGCMINLTFVATGVAENGSPCEICQPLVNPTYYSAAPDGTGCGMANGCFNGACVPGCTIDGGFFPNGAIDPLLGQGCGTCETSVSLASWQPLTGNVPSAGGGCPQATDICEVGVCTVGCFIDGEVFDAGALGATGVCCAPSHSTTSWSPLFSSATFNEPGAPWAFAVGDVDGKNGPDLVATDQAQNIEVFLNTGNGTFSTTPILTAGLGGIGVALGDFNGDGKLDVATTFNNGGSFQVQVQLGNGAGSFTAGPINGSQFGWVGGAAFLRGPAAPLNMIGQDSSYNDLSVGGVSTSGELTIYQHIGGVPLGAGSGFGVQYGLGDTNGDGRPDVAYPTSSGFVVYLNDGISPLNTAYETFGSANYGAIVEAAFLGHSYGTGAPILDVVAGTKDSTGVARLDVFANDGGGGYNLQQQILTPIVNATCNGFASADFNGDGILDVAGICGGAIVYFLGAGGGNFTYQGVLAGGVGNFSDQLLTLPLAYNEPALIGAVAGGGQLLVLQESTCQ